MGNKERILRRYEPECKRLYVAADLLNAFAPEGVKFGVDDTYLDFGADWMWTTIIAYRNFSYKDSYQALCPRDWKKICYGDMDDLVSVVKEILNSKLIKGVA